MWLNEQQVTDAAIRGYRKALVRACPRYVVIDQLFDPVRLAAVCRVLQQAQQWQTQKHSYAALYVKEATWQQTPQAQRFVQRDVWQRADALSAQSAAALEFLAFLRGPEFMALLSRIFSVRLTDIHVADPAINTNYFRLGAADFVNQHADDSPGREVCMLLYLNEHWQEGQGGELVFSGKDEQPVQITPLYNRCVLFDPASAGSEHWVNPLTDQASGQYRYNLTSWYWSE